MFGYIHKIIEEFLTDLTTCCVRVADCSKILLCLREWTYQIHCKILSVVLLDSAHVQNTTFLYKIRNGIF